MGNTVLRLIATHVIVPHVYVYVFTLVIKCKCNQATKLTVKVIEDDGEGSHSTYGHISIKCESLVGNTVLRLIAHVIVPHVYVFTLVIKYK